ncbi:MAG: sulfur carrier protein ThiS [Bryobacteraceae bacterium]
MAWTSALNCDWTVTYDNSERRNIVSNGLRQTTDSATVEIVVNGEPKRVPEGLSLEGLLAFLEVDPSRVAVERNREIVRKTEWAGTMVSAGDQLEVVWFVGGGKD